MYERLKYLPMVGALVLVAACAPTRVFVKTYDGMALQEKDSALLKPQIDIVSIDGDSTKAITPVRPGWTNIDADISLKPGPHTIEAKYNFTIPGYIVTVTHASVSNQSITYEFLAGRKYILSMETPSTTTWRPIVVDVTDSPKEWCFECYYGPSKPIPEEKRR